MSRIDRLVGIARSLAIYHGIPGRQRRMRRLYAGFVERGDIVFDIGAHAGNRVRAFAALGCRVVAVEPQPDFARMLRRFFRRSPRVVVVEAVVADQPGVRTLEVSERTPTVSTVAEGWRREREREPGFHGVKWSRRIDVQATTLDYLIERYGVPRFVKIDCEGSEPAILSALTHRISALSFEYLPWTLDEAEACVTRLAALGAYQYNWSRGESCRLAADRWLSGAELLQTLRTPDAQQRPGDVYARLA